MGPIPPLVQRPPDVSFHAILPSKSRTSCSPPAFLSVCICCLCQTIFCRSPHVPTLAVSIPLAPFATLPPLPMRLSSSVSVAVIHSHVVGVTSAPWSACLSPATMFHSALDPASDDGDDDDDEGREEEDDDDDDTDTNSTV